MDRYVVILFWILIVAVILLSTPTKCVMDDKKKEGFYTYNSYFKNYCGSCSGKTSYACAKCTNCGTCQTASGVSECVSGDSSGPYFRDDCVFYTYNNPYYYYPYSDSYPVIKTRSIYPFAQKRINRPWKWEKKQPLEIKS